MSDATLKPTGCSTRPRPATVLRRALPLLLLLAVGACRASHAAHPANAPPQSIRVTLPGTGTLVYRPGDAKTTTLPLWRTLPEVPPLPAADRSGYATMNGARLYYAVFNQDGGDPVILIHGGFGSSEDWGFEVPLLDKTHEVIVVDCRGRGRSTLGGQPLSYALMTSDILGLMDYLKVGKASIVGASDGGIIGLLIAIHHPGRLNKLFAWGANFSRSAYSDDLPDPGTGKRYMARAKATYERLSPTPGDFPKLLAAIGKLSTAEPEIPPAELTMIPAPTVIADGEYEQFITRAHTEKLARLIPDARLIIIPDVSHGGPTQDPAAFHRAVVSLLDGPTKKSTRQPAARPPQSNGDHP
ncbi:MAG: alpha/beta fold hydrolase [Gammaproteobacteria bacterium]